MPDQVVLTPLGELLERARSEVLHLSVRQAAKRAGISPTRWTQVVTGFAWRGGVQAPVRTTVRTVVAMALAVQVDPAEALDAARMPTAADAIEAIVAELQTPSEPAAPAPVDSLVDEIERIRHLPGISPDDKLRMVRAIVDLHEERAAAAHQG